MSKIEWTDRTWQPVVGCTPTSPGCAHCYAARMATRQVGIAATKRAKGKDPGGSADYECTAEGGRWTGRVCTLPRRLSEPLHWSRPCQVFVCSMGDLFHEDVPDAYIAAVFGVMAACPQHTFQVLTKRAERMAEWFARQIEGWHYEDMPDPPPHGWLDTKPIHWQEYAANWGVMDWPEPLQTSVPWPLPNVWLGVSAEDQQRADERIPHLLATPAAERFVSVEPMLGPVDLRRYLWTATIPCAACGEPFEAWEALCDCGSSGNWFDGPRTIACPHCGACVCDRSEDWHDDRKTTGRFEWENVSPEWGPEWGTALDLVIAGAETGPGARPMALDWARDLRGQCVAADVPFFFKRDSVDGRLWEQMP